MIETPPEWGSHIPTPLTVKTVVRVGDHDLLKDVWNPMFLQGLDAFVRRIVREELKNGTMNARINPDSP